MSDQNRNDDAKAPGATKADPIYHVDDRGGLSSVGASSTTDAHQPSALGGEVAARSGATEVAEGDEDTDDAVTGGSSGA